MSHDSALGARDAGRIRDRLQPKEGRNSPEVEKEGPQELDI